MKYSVVIMLYATYFAIGNKYKKRGFANLKRFILYMYTFDKKK